MRNHKGRIIAGSCVLTLVMAAAAVETRAQSPAAPAPWVTVTQTAYIKASNATKDAHFGSGGTLEGAAVALSADGTTMAVGAPDEASAAKGINGNQNDTSAYNAGAVYVFTKRGAAWTQQAYIKASNAEEGDHFGHMVVLSGDGNTMLVTARLESGGSKGVNGNGEDNSISQSGAAYVFVRRGTTWTQQAYLKASNPGEAGGPDSFGDGDQFGFSAAISNDGNTVAIGANAEDSNATGINGNQADNSMQSAGAVYVFARTGTTWAQQAYVKPLNTDGNDQFGYAVSLTADGNMLAVGSYDEDSSFRGVNGQTDKKRGGSGAVYVFGRTGTTWAQQAILKASNAEATDSMGVDVRISHDGNTLVAGAVDEDCAVTGVNPAGPCDVDLDTKRDTSIGAAYVFVRSGGTWSQQAFIKASNAGQDDTFGSRLAMSGDGNTLAISSPLEDGGAKGINGNQADNSASEAGAVYVFRRNGTTWAQQAYVKGSNTEAYDEFGGAVALSRDGSVLASGARSERSGAKGINGNQADNSAEGAGAVYVFTLTGKP